MKHTKGPSKLCYIALDKTLDFFGRKISAADATANCIFRKLLSVFWFVSIVLRWFESEVYPLYFSLLTSLKFNIIVL